MTERVRQARDGVAGRRFRTVGAAHLGLAGVANVATGVALLYLGATNRLVRWALTDLDTYVSAQRLVRDGNLVAEAATTGTLLAGATLVAVGAAALLVGYRVAHNRRPTRWGLAGVASAMNPLATPLACVALVLLWLDGRLCETDGQAGVRSILQ